MNGIRLPPSPTRATGPGSTSRRTRTGMSLHGRRHPATPTWNGDPSRRRDPSLAAVVLPVGADGARFAGTVKTYAGTPGNLFAEQTPACDASAVAGHGDCPASLVVGATCWPGEAYCGAGEFELLDATYCGFDQSLQPSPCRRRPALSCCNEALKRYGFEYAREL